MPTTSAQRVFDIAELRDLILLQAPRLDHFVFQGINKSFQSSVQNKQNGLLRRALFLEPDTSRQAVSPFLDHICNDSIASTERDTSIFRIRYLHLNPNNTRFELALEKCSKKEAWSGTGPAILDIEECSLGHTYLTAKPVTTCLNTCVRTGRDIFVLLEITAEAHLTVHAWLALLDETGFECLDAAKDNTSPPNWTGVLYGVGDHEDVICASKDIGGGQSVLVKTTTYRRSSYGNYVETAGDMNQCICYLTPSLVKLAAGLITEERRVPPDQAWFEERHYCSNGCQARQRLDPTLSRWMRTPAMAVSSRRASDPGWVGDVEHRDCKFHQ
ncbi:hypothetical protein LTR56_010019 [Elasticomyces elasticus]|nr:hypothetical protein LTR56_010019 [Elasticomyces elasticus]KAK4931581.1 hypothetical protein LTR49_001970 [Elasticomyces elasticus]KAK5766741.1 hypothetical protein LTS12_003091 [Elasticomyces elasticus]